MKCKTLIKAAVWFLVAIPFWRPVNHFLKARQAESELQQILATALVDNHDSLFDRAYARSIDDPWGSPYRIDNVLGLGGTGPAIRSAGSDRDFGTQDDLVVTTDRRPDGDSNAAKAATGPAATAARGARFLNANCN